jgi:release factor glutamine methyltransferase
LIAARIPSRRLHAESLLLEHARRLSRVLGIDAEGARLEAECLMRHVLGVGRATLIAHPELIEQAALSPSYQRLLQRRMDGEPIAYLIGSREFYGRSFAVNRAALIPRPETELLVDLALERLPVDMPAEVMDIGTGSGCVAISIAKERPRARVLAVDISSDALALAQENACRLGAGNLEFLQGDCYAPLLGRRAHVIVSNPPYIAQGDAHLSAGDLRFEPLLALLGGADGLSVLERVIAGAPGHLYAGGWVLVEHGFDQAEPIRALLRQAGFVRVFSARDLAGVERASGGLCRE